MEKIKVLHVLVSNKFSGAENVVCQISNVFKNDGNFEIIYCSPDGPIRKALKEKGVEFVPLKKASIKELRRVIKEVNPSIVHAHDMRASFLAFMASGKTPFIAHIHNNNYDSRKFSLKSVLFYLAAKSAKHIFWVSETSLNGYIYNKNLKNKSSILYNVIDPKSVNALVMSDKNIYNYDFIFIGRLTFQKNPQRLVRIMGKAIGKEPGIKFAIIGEGELRNEIEHYIEERNLSENIDVLGFMSNPYKIIQSSKALLLASRWEGYPMVAIEAFSLGTPVISTPVDGLRELISNHIDGYTSDNDDELVNEIIDVYNSPEYRDKLSQGAKQKIAQIMHPQLFKKTILDSYNNILKT